MDTRDIINDRVTRATPAGITVSARASVLGTVGPDSAARTGHGGPAGAIPFHRQLAQLRAGEGRQPGPGAVTGTAGTSATPDAAPPVTVRRGDTLTSLVRAQWQAHGGSPEALSAPQAHRWALQVARENGLADADRIRVGQSLVVTPFPVGRSAVAGVAQPTQAAQATPTASAASPPGKPNSGLATSAAVPIVRVDAAGAAGRLNHPLLSQTLDRAVDLGYVPASDRQRVGTRIEALAGKHGFHPDDFAKAVLMESDGLNPRATNGQCHGIIQFCAGPDRGAASAGYGSRPKEILGLSVLKQLDLVDRYFDDTKLREFRGRDGRVRLDDLYLTILTPAARQERSPNAPLPIAGPQALDLHERRERHAPITRSSILAGLNVNARARLGQFMVAELALR